MKKILVTMLSATLLTTGIQSVVSCGVKFINKPGDNTEETTYLNLADIEAQTVGIRLFNTLEEVNEALALIRITGVKSLVAQTISTNNSDVLVTIQLQDGYALVEKTLQFSITFALRLQNTVYTEEVKQQIQITQAPNLETINNQLRELEIMGVDFLVAQYLDSNKEDIKIKVAVLEDWALVGEPEFILENVVNWIVVDTFEGTKDQLRQLMRDARSVYEFIPVEDVVAFVGEFIITFANSSDIVTDSNKLYPNSKNQIKIVQVELTDEILEIIKVSFLAAQIDPTNGPLWIDNGDYISLTMI